MQSRVRGCQAIHAESRIRKRSALTQLCYNTAFSSKSLGHRLVEQPFMRKLTAVIAVSLTNARAPYFYFTSLLHFVKSSNCLPLVPAGLKQQLQKSLATCPQHHLNLLRMVTCKKFTLVRISGDLLRKFRTLK